MVFQRSKSDRDLGIRPYVDTILSSLNSHMDVQSADGKALLLKYVSSYVTKLKDHEILDSYTADDVKGIDIGARYMKHLKISEPEMIQHFSNSRVAHHKGESCKLLLTICIYVNFHFHYMFKYKLMSSSWRKQNVRNEKGSALNSIENFEFIFGYVIYHNELSSNHFRHHEKI